MFVAASDWPSPFPTRNKGSALAGILTESLVVPAQGGVSRKAGTGGASRLPWLVILCDGGESCQ